nr:uncharacterized protein LOC103426785 [Malus domestica]
MREAVVGFFVVVYLQLLQLSSANIVLQPSGILIPDLPAKYAVAVGGSEICGALLVADPLDACLPLRYGVQSNETDITRFALVERGECTFEDKVQHAQNAGFHAVIVYDNRREKLVHMTINSKNVTIRAVFVSKASGEMLKEHARGEEGECCIFVLPNEKAWSVFAVCFISFLTVLGLLVIALCAQRNWSWTTQGRNQLPKSADTKIVDALPCFTFSSAGLDECHTEETCAICLENYKDSEILKVLPCQHEFHSSCVDSWLKKWGRNCPVCKNDIRKKIANAERISHKVITYITHDWTYAMNLVEVHIKGGFSLGGTMLCGPMIETASSFSSPSVRNSSGLPHRKTKHRSSSKVPQPTFSILSWFSRKINQTANRFHKNQSYLYNTSSSSWVLLEVVLLCCSSESEVVTVDVQEAKHLLESGYGYLEVRTEEEYKKGHVDTKKILNIPYMFNTPKGMVKNPQFLEEVSSACNKDDLIVVGCQSGVRSLYATADLLAAGFKNVSNMGGGYLAWIEHDFPVTKPGR